MRNLRRLQSLMEEKRVEKLVVADPGFIAWLLDVSYDMATGGLALIVERDSATLLAPPLEVIRASSLESLELVVYTKYGVKPEGVRVIEGSLREAVCKLAGGAYAGDQRAQRLLSECGSAGLLEDDLWRLRMVKEWWEVERIAEATRVTEEAIIRAISALSEGVSEAEVAAILEYWLRILGSETHAFVTAGGLSIVAFGANTSMPHYQPSLDARLGRDTPVLIDTGGVVKHYCGDVTRVYWFGSSVDREWLHVLEAVESAVGEAIDTVEPGVEARAVDEAARRALGGYAKWFIHSTGHGIGVEVHEKPGITPAEKTRLEKGMVFTIEPGVYMPGKWGIRLEQVVVVEERGARVLNKLPLRL